MGRKTTFSETTASAICKRLEDGEALAVVCRELDVGRRTVYDWVEANEAFAARFAQARGIGFESMADSAFLTSRGFDETKGGYSTGDVARDRLIVDTTLKLLAKLDPKRFGDLLKLGNPDGNGLTVNIVRLSQDS